MSLDVVVCTVYKLAVHLLLRFRLVVDVGVGIYRWHLSLYEAAPHVVRRAVRAVDDGDGRRRVIAMILFALVLVLLFQLVHCRLEFLRVRLSPMIQLHDTKASIDQIIFLNLKYHKPWRQSGQVDVELASRQRDASARDRFRLIANEHVRPERVVHVVPRPLQHLAILLLVKAQILQIHDDELVWMLHMHAEAELLEDAPLCLYRLILKIHVGLVEEHRYDGSKITQETRMALLSFANQIGWQIHNQFLSSLDGWRCLCV